MNLSTQGTLIVFEISTENVAIVGNCNKMKTF